MNNLRMALANMQQSEVRLRAAEHFFNLGEYPYVVRQSQEAVKLALKGALRAVGIEPPRWHDVGPILRRSQDRFPEWFRELIPRLARVSGRLSREREPSMYGDEEAGLPPSELYDEEDAREALEMARETVEACRRLIRSSRTA
mgnify:CR=1 FL=1